MEHRAAGNIFWASFLVLFPVAGQLSSLCVTYEQMEIYGLKGMTVEFPCSYQHNNLVNQISGWRRSSQIKSNQMTTLTKEPSYLFRVKYLNRGANDCTIELKDLKESDTSVYYFKYYYKKRNNIVTCHGVPGVRLYVCASPVKILVRNMVHGRRTPVIDRTVLEGQRIMLTCVLNCTVDLNSNPGYIWYKDRRQLTNSIEKSPSLFLDPIRNQDGGEYSCAMIGYENLQSSPVNLKVQTSPRNTWNIVTMDGNPGGGSKKDTEATLTRGCDVQSSIDQHLNNCQAHKGKSISTFSTVLLTCVSAGLVVAAMVTILALRMKNRSNFCSAPHIPRTMSDPYVALDISHMSAEYDMLNSVKQSPTADTNSTIYENLPKHEYETG